MHAQRLPQPEPEGADVVVEDAVRCYGEGAAAVRALDGVSLEIAQGEFVAVMGPSGSGKSTLLSVLGGLESLSSGRVLVGGRDVGRLQAAEAARYRRREVGFVFQSFNLLPRLTVLENAALPLVFDGRPQSERERRARALLLQLGLGRRLQSRPATLSGGEKQRAAIARALVNEPRLLLADEPTGNVDSANARSILELLDQLNQERGQTIVLVTHDPEVARHAGRLVQMRDGRVVEAA